MFKVDDIVEFTDVGTIAFSPKLLGVKQKVLQTNGEFVITNIMSNWTHRNWFVFVTNKYVEKIRYPYPENFYMRKK